MSLDRKDLVYLYDIFMYSKLVNGFVKGVKYYHYSINKEKQMAVERGVEIIGEASNKLSPEAMESLPNIPWRKIVGLRNRLAHEYKDIKVFKMWELARNDIPVLIRELKKIEELKEYIKQL